MKITKIQAEQILDSRGNPTVNVQVFSDDQMGQFAVPSGASTGSFEAVEKRDGDQNEFRGLGVLKVIEGIKNEIEPALLGQDATKQQAIDKILIELDGTDNKSRLGANALIGVSIAVCKLAATLQNQPVYEYLKQLVDIKPSRSVPYLFMNLVNGGKHAQSKLSFQEYMVVPQTDSTEDALNIGTLIFNKLKEMAVKQLGPQSADYGDEGGVVLDTDQVDLPLQFLKQIIDENNLTGKVKLALDVAASSFYQDGVYQVGNKSMTAEDLLSFYELLTTNYQLLSIEDPFFEEDFNSFANLQSKFDGMVVGDDLTVTNIKRLKEAVEKKSIKAVIIKPNQIGTLTETLDTMKEARDNSIECIVSHRSGETNDDFIADLAFAFGAFGLKAGAPQRGERVAKYNRLNLIAKQEKII